MQSLAGDKGIWRGDIAAPAFPWGVRAGGPSGLGGGGHRTGLRGLPQHPWSCSMAEVSPAEPGNTVGRGGSGNTGTAIPVGYQGSQERGCFLPSCLGLLAGGWRVFLPRRNTSKTLS